MRWTAWRKLAQGQDWYADKFDHEGPACYELSITGPRGGKRETVYVGETSNERRRISEYGRSGSHLNRHVDSELSAGKCIWYRAIAVNSKADAKSLQDRMLAKFGYPWNRHGQ